MNVSIRRLSFLLGPLYFLSQLKHIITVSFLFLDAISVEPIYVCAGFCCWERYFLSSHHEHCCLVPVWWRKILACDHGNCCLVTTGISAYSGHRKFCFAISGSSALWPREFLPCHHGNFCIVTAGISALWSQEFLPCEHGKLRFLWPPEYLPSLWPREGSESATCTTSMTQPKYYTQPSRASAHAHAAHITHACAQR